MPATVNWTMSLQIEVLSVYIIVLTIGLPANLLACYIFIQKVKQKAKPIDILLLGLNISDLIFLFFLCIRIKEAAEMGWNMSPLLCPIAMYVSLINIYNSTFFLASISMERYLGVIFAVWYKVKRHPRNAIITSVLIWVFNLGHCSIVYYIQLGELNENQTEPGLDPDSNNTCYWNFNDKKKLDIVLSERFGVFIVAIFIPLAICCFCYINIIKSLLRLSNDHHKKRSKSIGLAIVTLVIFMFCFMPFGVSHVQGLIMQKNPSWRVHALLCSSVNTLLDPFIYYFSCQSMHKTLKRYLTIQNKESGDNNSSPQNQEPTDEFS